MSETYVPVALRRRVAEQARHRCGYCLRSEDLCGAEMHVEHIRPEADGGPTVEENLWLACSECNNYKNDRLAALDPISQQIARLFDPRHQVWAEHFCWNQDGDVLIGLTPTGRATAAALKLNRPLLMRARRVWVLVGRHPPQD